MASMESTASAASVAAEGQNEQVERGERGERGLVPGPRRFLLLLSVAVCAASGLVYELALISLSTSLNGGGIVETSLIVAGYVAALGLGALCAKPLLKWAETAFLWVEATLGVVGGLSATLLYLAFAVTGQSLILLVLATLLIGMLVGAELPLLMTMFQRGRLVDAKESGSILATLNVADYLGALLGGLAWPFLLLPHLGLLQGTAAAGLLNLVAALVVAALVLRWSVARAHLALVSTVIVVAIVGLTVLIVRSDGVVATARQRLFQDPIIYSQQSQYQDIVVTKDGKDRRLFLNGGLQYSTRDEYRYTESLVYPAITPEAERVLIIGGGDGLAARELLRMDHIQHIEQVELDPEMIRVANTVLREDNQGSLEDPRVHVRTEDAFTWVRSGGGGVPPFDAILVDLSDPDNDTMARLYSQEFYGLLHKLLDPQGRMVVQSGSAFTTPDVFNRVRSTLKAAGCAEVVPYHVHVPTFGDWGFNMCAPKNTQLGVPSTAPELRYLNMDTLRAAGVFPPDNPLVDLPPNTLDHPVIVEDLQRGYRAAGE